MTDIDTVVALLKRVSLESAHAAASTGSGTRMATGIYGATRNSLETLGLLISFRRRFQPDPPCAWYTRNAHFVVFPIRPRDTRWGAFNHRNPNMQQIPRSRRADR